MFDLRRRAKLPERHGDQAIETLPAAKALQIAALLPMLLFRMSRQFSMRTWLHFASAARHVRCQAMDVTVFYSVPLILSAAALLAAYVPATRAAKVDPMQVLRTE
jgi:hypothetical protein